MFVSSCFKSIVDNDLATSHDHARGGSFPRSIGPGPRSVKALRTRPIWLTRRRELGCGKGRRGAVGASWGLRNACMAAGRYAFLARGEATLRVPSCRLLASLAAPRWAPSRSSPRVQRHGPTGSHDHTTLLWVE